MLTSDSAQFATRGEGQPDLITLSANAAHSASRSGAGADAASAARIARVLISRAPESELASALSQIIPPLGTLWAEAARWANAGGDAAEGARSLRHALLDLVLGVVTTPAAFEALSAFAGVVLLARLASAALSLSSEDDDSRQRGAQLLAALFAAAGPPQAVTLVVRGVLASTVADAARAGSGAGTRYVSRAIATWVVWETSVETRDANFIEEWKAVGAFFAATVTHEQPRDARALASAFSVCISAAPAHALDFFMPAVGRAVVGWTLGASERARRSVAAADSAAALRASVLLASAHSKRKAASDSESKLPGDCLQKCASMSGDRDAPAQSYGDTKALELVTAPTWSGEAARAPGAPVAIADDDAASAWVKSLARMAVRDAHKFLRACQLAAKEWPSALVASGLLAHGELALEIAAESGLGIIRPNADYFLQQSTSAKARLAASGIETAHLAPLFGTALAIAMVDTWILEATPEVPRDVWDSALYVIAAAAVIPIARSGHGEAIIAEPMKSLVTRGSMSTAPRLLSEIYAFAVHRNTDILEGGAARTAALATKASEVARLLAAPDMPPTNEAVMSFGASLSDADAQETAAALCEHLFADGLAPGKTVSCDTEEVDADDESAGATGDGGGAGAVELLCVDQWRLYASRCAEFQVSMLSATRSMLSSLSAQIGPGRFATILDSLPQGLRNDLS
jgi:hypothetical protein